MKVLHLLLGLLLVISPALGQGSIALNKKFALQGTTLVYNSNLSSDPDRNYITFDDAKVFKKYLDENNIKTLRLTSEGGQQGASLDIKDLVLEHELNTEAKGECSSACSIIFVAGQKRKLIGRAKLGFHTTFTRIEDFEKRKKLVEGLKDNKIYFPPLERCTDNGAMVAFAGSFYLGNNNQNKGDQVRPKWPLSEL